MVYFKKIETIFRPFFNKNAHFRHKSVLENGRMLKFFVGPPNIYLSRVKKSSLYLLPVTNDSRLKSAPLHITAYFLPKIRHLKVVGCNFFGGPPNIYLSRVKKIKSLFASCHE